METKFTEYTFKQKLGMEGIGDYYYEYMSPKEIEKDRKEEEQRIQKLKDSEEYGKEYLYTISIEQDDMFDRQEQKSTTSYRAVILNLGDGQ